MPGSPQGVVTAQMCVEPVIGRSPWFSRLQAGKNFLWGGRVFRPVNKAGRLSGDFMTPQAVYNVVAEHAAVEMLAASDILLGSVIEEVNEAAPGTVLRSQPAVGTEVELGARVHLIVAAEPE